MLIKPDADIIIEQVKVPKKKNYKSLKERFENLFDENPIDPIDFSKFGRNEFLFITFQALHEYYSKNNSLPELNNKSQVDEIVKRTKEIYDNKPLSNYRKYTRIIYIDKVFEETGLIKKERAEKGRYRKHIIKVLNDRKAKGFIKDYKTITKGRKIEGYILAL